MIDRKKHIEELLAGAEGMHRKASALSRQKKEINITGSQWLVVAHIFRNEGSTTNDVARALKMSGSAVTQLVNGLVARHYVMREKDPADRRAHRLMLSAQSKKLINKLKNMRVKMMLGLFKGLSDKEFTQFVALHKKLIGSINKK